MKFVLIISLLVVSLPGEARFSVHSGQNADEVRRNIDNQQYDPASSIMASRARQNVDLGPRNAYNIVELRREFSRQWISCQEGFALVDKNCANTESLDEKNAKTCVQMYQVAYNQCYAAMNVFAFHFS